MESTPVMAVLGPVLMSLVVASLVGGVYVFVRGQLFTDESTSRTPADEVTGADRTASSDDTADTDDPTASGRQQPDPAAQRQLLDVLPEDERKILEPVIDSPGLTQIQVRDRSGFSKSKVSQTVTDLEARGLLYRERQGRTYRVYPADDIDERL